MPRGGKRVGSGRPKGTAKAKPTVTMRVPIQMHDEIKNYVDSDGFKLPYFSSKISAGTPSFANDDIDGYFNLHSMFIKNPKESYYFSISGDSMIKAGIMDGDTVIVDRSITPKNGMIVAALVDNASTVKRLRIDKTGVYLVPENDNYQPTKITKYMDFKIDGVVTTVMRRTI